MSKKRITPEKELADEHWKYIKSVLLNHKIELPELMRIGFHYRTAMIHGYKHGWFDAMKEKKTK